MRGLSLGIIFLAFVQVLGKEKDGRHPVYIIAHMINSIPEVDVYLRRGANAIETDVMFDYNAVPEATYHGHPCDCFRVCTRKESFANFISYIRNITTPGTKYYKEQLALLFLDLKTSGVSSHRKYSAGVNLAKTLMKHLWNGGDNATSINLLISIGRTYDSQVIRGVVRTLKGENLDYLLPKIGFDVGLNDHPLKIERMWKSLGMTLNKWQGDGITNCLFPMRSTRRLESYLKMKRDGENYMSKLYQWTVDFTVSFRKSLGLGVEAFITNYPERLRSVLEESQIRQHFRLATIEDDSWELVPTYPTVITDLTAVQPFSIKVYSVAQEVVDSLATFVGDAFNVSVSQGVNNQEYVPLVKYMTKIDRSEDAQMPESEDFCQYSLCTLYELYSKRASPPRLSFDTECMNKTNTPGVEIKTICTHLQNNAFGIYSNGRCNLVKYVNENFYRTDRRQTIRCNHYIQVRPTKTGICYNGIESLSKFNLPISEEFNTCLKLSRGHQITNSQTCMANPCIVYRPTCNIFCGNIRNKM